MGWRCTECIHSIICINDDSSDALSENLYMLWAWIRAECVNCCDNICAGIYQLSFDHYYFIVRLIWFDMCYMGLCFIVYKNLMFFICVGLRGVLSSSTFL